MRRVVRDRRASIGVLAAGLLLSALATWLVDARVRSHDQRDFDRLAEGARTSVAERVTAATEVLFGLRSLFAQSSAVGRSDFARYVEATEALDRFPGLQALELAHLVRRSDLAGYEAAAGFRVHPAGSRPDLYVVEYVEPLAGNEPALGLDLAAEAARRGAVEQARDSGDAVATAPIELVQLQGSDAERRGFLLFLALYDPAKRPVTVPEHRRAFRGAVLAVFRVQSLLERISARNPSVRLEIYDVGPTVEPARPTLSRGNLVFSTTGGALVAPRAGSVRRPHRFLDLDAGTRRWRLFADAGPDFGSGSGTLARGLALGLGLTASIGAAGATNSFVGRRRRRREEAFRSFLELTPDAVVVADATGRITHVNAQLGELFGYPPGELIGRPVETLIPERLARAHAGHLAGYVRTPETRPMGAGIELVGRRRDGTEFATDVSLAPVHAEEGTLFAAAVRDATKRKEAERLKDEFLAITAHELRTPLAAIVGFAELLRAGPGGLAEPARARILGRLAANATDMTGMVERLLDLSRLDAGRVQVEPHTLDLRGEVAIHVDALAEVLAGHEVAVDMAPGLAVVADHDALGHVLRNLLGNAAKFAPPGTRITVRARADTDAGVATVSVADQGTGIPPEDHERVFDRFVQSAAQATGGRRGAGIGLSIVKRYVELLGGRVWIDRTAGEGATISFTLPLAG